jgi:hypothetical protein
MKRFDDIRIDGQEKLTPSKLLYKRIVYILKENNAIGISIKDFNLLISNNDFLTTCNLVSDLAILKTGLYCHINNKPVYVFSEKKPLAGHYFDDALLMLK